MSIFDLYDLPEEWEDDEYMYVSIDERDTESLIRYIKKGYHI